MIRGDLSLIWREAHAFKKDLTEKKIFFGIPKKIFFSVKSFLKAWASRQIKLKSPLIIKCPSFSFFSNLLML